MKTKVNVKIHLNDGVKKFELNQKVFTIGRTNKADIVVDNELLSRRHLKVKLDSNEIKIQDLGTTNGSFLGGDRIVPHQWYPLKSGNILSLGNRSLVVEISHENFVKDEEVSEQDNLVEFGQKNEDKTGQFNLSGPKGPFIQRSSVAGNNAFKLEDHDSTSPFSIEADKSLEAIRDRVSMVSDSQFSEIEQLELQKIEIESKVLALKIKEEAEYEAKRIIDEALSKSNEEVDEAQLEAKEIIEDFLGMIKENPELETKLRAGMKDLMIERKD